jgi:hypothetical protein
MYKYAFTKKMKLEFTILNFKPEVEPEPPLPIDDQEIKEVQLKFI